MAISYIQKKLENRVSEHGAGRASTWWVASFFVSLVISSLFLSAALAEMSDAELVEAYLKDVLTPSVLPGPVEATSVLYPEVIARGPNILVTLMPIYKQSVEDFFNVNVSDEQARRMTPLYFVARKLTGVFSIETYDFVKDLRSRCEQSQEVPEAPNAGASEEAERKPVHQVQLVDWWDARGLFLDSMDRGKGD